MLTFTKRLKVIDEIIQEEKRKKNMSPRYYILPEFIGDTAYMSDFVEDFYQSDVGRPKAVTFDDYENYNTF